MHRVVFRSYCLPSQKRFYNSKARFKGFSGPIGSGKTFALVGQALRMAALNRGRVGLLGAPTFPMLRDVTLRTLLDELEERRVPYKFHKQEMSITLKRLGSKILMRSLKDYERLRGTNLAWFGVDELSFAEEEAWLRLEGRLRDPKATELCGFGVWTPNGFDWVYERFISPTGKKDGYEAVLAAPGENIAMLSKNPDFYDRLKTSYDEKFFRQEVLGEYLDQNAGAPYHAWDDARHTDDLKFNPAVPLSICMDFNIDPMAWIFAQHYGGNVYALDELTVRSATTLDTCKRMTDKIEEPGGYLDQWRKEQARPMDLLMYGDAAGEHGSTSGKSDYALIKEYFRTRPQYKLQWNVATSNPEIRDRVNSVNAMLMNAAGKQRCWVDKKCKRLRIDFRRCVWDEKDPGHKIDKDTKHDSMTLTHHSDAFGYLIWKEYRVQSFDRTNAYN